MPDTTPCLLCNKAITKAEQYPSCEARGICEPCRKANMVDPDEEFLASESWTREETDYITDNM